MGEFSFFSMTNKNGDAETERMCRNSFNGKGGIATTVVAAVLVAGFLAATNAVLETMPDNGRAALEEMRGLKR